MRAVWLLVAAVLGGLIVWQARPWWEQRDGAVGAEPRVVAPRGDLAADEKSTIELFERSKDSVVFITTTQLVRSGFVWDNEGHVVPNSHVVRGAAEAKVRLNDGRDYSARLVGASPAHEIAVLRIRVPERQPPALPIGSSADLKVGLDWSLTTGVVSALDRSLPAEDGRTIIEHLIQTDAAINPGNSGGPLLDSSGRVIGITTVIFSPSGAYAGVGFSVPIDTLNRVVAQLIAKGKYTRAVLASRPTSSSIS